MFIWHMGESVLVLTFTQIFKVHDNLSMLFTRRRLRASSNYFLLGTSKILCHNVLSNNCACSLVDRKEKKCFFSLHFGSGFILFYRIQMCLACLARHIETYYDKWEMTNIVEQAALRALIHLHIYATNLNKNETEYDTQSRLFMTLTIHIDTFPIREYLNPNYGARQRYIICWSFISGNRQNTHSKALF